jgi:hypothetical protein
MMTVGNVKVCKEICTVLSIFFTPGWRCLLEKPFLSYVINNIAVGMNSALCPDTCLTTSWEKTILMRGQEMKKCLVAIMVLLLLTAASSSLWAKALLVEDTLPWEFNSNSKTLTDIGIEFDKINSSQISATDLSDYQFIVYASTQYQSYYDNVAANFSSIDSYVQGGGILVAHSCIWGWPGNGVWTAGSYLPGGVGRVHENSNSVRISDAASPIVSGPYGTLSEADFQAWSYTTHGYFTDLVAGTHVSLDLNDPTKPIYIDYQWGLGQVRASMMTVEWGNNDPSNTRYIFRENEFYAAGNPVPEPSTFLLMGLGIAGVALLRRKFRA